MKISSELRLRRSCAAVLSGIVVMTSVFAVAPREARADEVAPTAKGVVGGGLLGAEVVTITESLIGVRNGWAYVIGGAVGAGGGAVGGYFVEQNSTDGRAPVFMLAGGLALVIPAIVLSLNATRYRASEEAIEDNAPTNEPAADPAGNLTVGGGSSAAGTTPPAAPPAAPAPATTPAPAAAPATPPTSLLNLKGGDFLLGVPVPEVRPVFSTRDLRQYGMAQQTELRLPVVNVTF